MHLLYIKITKNNIILSITDQNGNVLLQKTAGSAGFRKEECNSFATATGIAQQVSTLITTLNIETLGIYIRGVTGWKFDTIDSFLVNTKIKINFIRDISSTPHNGCSPEKKARRKRHNKKNLVNKY